MTREYFICSLLEMETSHGVPGRVVITMRVTYDNSLWGNDIDRWKTYPRGGLQRFLLNSKGVNPRGASEGGNRR